MMSKLNHCIMQSPAWLAAIVLAVVGMISAGCSPQAESRHQTRSSSNGAESGAGALARGIGFLDRLDEFDREQATVQATYHLNRWLDGQGSYDDWSVDPLIETLPPAMRNSELVDTLPKLQFRIADARGLSESLWLRRLAGWISRNAQPGPLSEVLDRQLDGMQQYEAEQLLVADRLFDWTVRNIQLDELLPHPDGASCSADSSSPEADKRRPAAMRGEPGPGYQYSVWETLIYGHGDAHSRARVFIGLARQQGIGAVMLALPGETSRPRPWLPAVFIGDQLYLYDAQLGTPIPGPDGQWVATIEQVVKNPSLLSGLDIGQEYTYPVTGDDLSGIVALVDAPPHALSKKMEVVQSHLTGDRRVALTVQASALAAKLENVSGISEVALWTAPFESHWYQQAREEMLKKDREAATQDYLEHGMLKGRSVLARGRYHHLSCEFETDDDQQGAKTLYLESRVPDSRIEQLETSEEVQREFGLQRRPGEHEGIWSRRVAATKMMLASSKRHASYWLGLAHYETGNYKAAQQWFEARTLEPDPEGRWADGARYNLGRTYEALGEPQKARELYLVDESLQAHGNLLRARLLRQHQAAR